MGNIINGITNELDRIAAQGPVKYFKDRISDLRHIMKNTFGGSKGKSHNGKKPHYEHGDDLSAEAIDFINDHMTELQEIIIKTVKRIKPSEYPDQQRYLEDVFDQASDSCWEYIKDIFSDPEISPELSKAITEEMVKDTAVVVASAMFIEWALTQKSDGNDDNEIYEEEVEA